MFVLWLKPQFFLSLSLAKVVHLVDDQSIETIRFFRVEQTYAVKTGKWYFEFEALSGGAMKVGWARPGCRPDVELGMDDQAFVFDGYRVNDALSYRILSINEFSSIIFYRK